MNSPKQVLVQDHDDLANANQERFDRLRAEGMGLDPVSQVMVAFRTLLDQLYGVYDVDTPTETSIPRLNYEIAFEKEMGKTLESILDQASVLKMRAEHPAASSGLVIPAGVQVPPPDLRVVT